MRRIVVPLICIGLAAACSSTDTATPPATTAPTDADTLAHFDNGAVSFDYPAAWTLQDVNDMASAFSTPIAYLSPMTLQDPCVTTEVSTGSQITCGFPVEQLDEGAVLVSWASTRFPQAVGSPPSGLETPNTTIAGKLARVQYDEPGTCAPIGADQTVLAVVDAGNGGTFEMTACVKDPSRAEVDASITQMLQSVSVTP